MDMAPKSAPGWRFAEFITAVTSGKYDGKMGRARLIGQTGILVDAGDMTREEQSLVLREWMHPRRQPPSREEKPAAWSPPVMCEVEDAEDMPGGG